jgi:hypothetical protein
MVAKLGATSIWRIFGVAGALQSVANFRELCHGEVRLSPGPVGEDFSGSCTVTSRNPLIHNGATNSTKSKRFDAEGVPPCCSRVLSDVPNGLLATVNFREFLFFFSTTFVNKGLRTGHSLVGLDPSRQPFPEALRDGLVQCIKFRFPVSHPLAVGCNHVFPVGKHPVEAVAATD